MPVLMTTRPGRPGLVVLRAASGINQRTERRSYTHHSLPAHRFLDLRTLEASGYFEFWEKQKGVSGLDCHTVLGLPESIPSRNGQIGEWFNQDGRRGYLHGIEVPVDYAGLVPKGMACTLIPAGDYVVFHHPAFDFEREDQEVYGALQEAVATWEPEAHGYAFDEALPTYQRHASDTWGQAFCRPAQKLQR